LPDKQLYLLKNLSKRKITGICDMSQLINTFNNLVEIIQRTDQALQNQAVRAVNVALTFRNWLVGFYIVEFEQNGEDRAKYGKQLLKNLAQQLKIRGLSAPELSRCRQFYNTYPEIFGTVSQELIYKITSLNTDLSNQDSGSKLLWKIFGTLTQELQSADNNPVSINHLVPDPLPGSSNDFQLLLFNRAPFSHFVELIKITEPAKRQFYELYILKTTPTFRELQRAIRTLTYERFGLSGNKEKTFQQILSKIQPAQSSDIIKSHYFFDFLNINQPHLIEESELEQALINHLQQFIIELGNGFCFEARQKRLLIGDEYFFVDLVFYHRILKSHILIELKVDSFNHGHASQLVTYLNYFRQNLMEESDNPPIGILLVTDKNTALVEYATANEKDRLFVSKYKLQLPSEQELKEFLENELRKEIEG